MFDLSETSTNHVVLASPILNPGRVGARGREMREDKRIRLGVRLAIDECVQIFFADDGRGGQDLSYLTRRR